MLKENTAIQNSIKDDGTRVCLGTEVDTLAIGSIAVVAGFVGAWTIARVAGAMLISGGPIALVQAWFNAVSGGM